MSILKRRRFAVGILVAVAWMTTPAARAEFIAGTASIVANVSEDKTTLAQSNVFTFSTGFPSSTSNQQSVTGATGNYQTFLTSADVTSTTLDLNTPSTPISMTFGTAGTFTGISIIEEDRTSANSFNYLTVTVSGTFTPAGAFASAGFVATSTTVTFSFNQPIAGGAIGYGASLVSMPTVPEPASMALMGTGLTGFGVRALARRRANI